MIGCSDGPGPSGPVSVTVGTGERDFEPLADDQRLEIVRGCQGGYHFIVHARMSGLFPGDWRSPGEIDNPTTTFAAATEAGVRVDARFPPYRLGYREHADGDFALPSGRLLILDEGAPGGLALPEDLYGQRLRIRVAVTDVQGRTGSDERWVVAAEWSGQDCDGGLRPDAGEGEPADAGP